MKKPIKLTLKDKDFYWILSLVAIGITALTFYLLSAVILNTEIFDHINDKELKAERVVEWMNGKLLGYISNSVFLVAYALFIVMGRRQIGWVVVYGWIPFFVAMAAFPFYSASSFDEPIRATASVIIIITMVLLVYTTLKMGLILRKLKRVRNREMYMIHKQKKGKK